MGAFPGNAGVGAGSWFEILAGAIRACGHPQPKGMRWLLVGEVIGGRIAHNDN